LTTSTTGPAAVITGGTSGIGLATARLLHESGYRVLVTGRDPRTLAAARHELPDTVAVLRADARSLADADTLAAELERRYGTVDLVFLNAGHVRVGALDTVDEESFDQQFDVNVKGQFFTLQRVLPLLRAGAAVVFNSSVLADKGMAQLSVYSATKGAMLSMVRALSVELAPRGIRVNAVSPGPVETPAHGKTGLPPEAVDAVKADLASQVPLRRLGSDQEIARMVAFLASPAASFITGANMIVDGGFGAT
jgi:NAD(P)-dependent dehydrogenase (short-subunit alcohol dehydrogenase family)